MHISSRFPASLITFSRFAFALALLGSPRFAFAQTPSPAPTPVAPAAPAPPPAAPAPPPAAPAPPPKYVGPISHFGWYPYNSVNRLHGFQLGVINGAEEMQGFQLSLLNAAADAEGLQIGLASIAKKLSGVQISVSCFQLALEMRGLQLGLGVQAATKLRGVQLGSITYAKDTEGVQLGLVNIASQMRGVQIGVANYTSEQMKGLQIGLVNISRGAPLSIGLLNITLDGRTELVARASASGFMGGVVRNGGAHHHNLYLVDYDPWLRALRLGIGLGLHFDLGWGALDVDATFFGVRRRDRSEASERYHDVGVELDPLVVIHLNKAIGITAGPGLVYMYGDDDPNQFGHGLGWTGAAQASGNRSSVWLTGSVGFRVTLMSGTEQNAERSGK